MSGYPADWDTRRRTVYKRDEYTCCNCQRRGGPYGDLELHAHHIVPKGRGGTHDYSNLITTCEPCHAAIHNKGVVAPTASVAERAPSVDVLDAAKEAKKTYRSVKRIMRLFS